jgi:hypothetical protein
MADPIRSDVVYSGVLTTTEATVATIAANTTFIVKGFWISNSNSASQTAILKFDDKRMVPGTTIPTHDSLVQDNLHIPLLTGKTIKITGSVNTDMDYYIWGIQEVV